MRIGPLGLLTSLVSGVLGMALGTWLGLWIGRRSERVVQLRLASTGGAAARSGSGTVSTMVVLTLALVLVTLYYAWQTRQTVREMREARHAQVRPHLVPFFRYNEPGVGIGAIYIVNLGQGSALDIDATMSLEPDGIVTRWRAAILRSGRRRVWSPTAHGGRKKTLHPVLAAGKSSRTVVHIAGRCRDVLGIWHDFEERVPLRDDWEIMVDMKPDSVSATPEA
jgi:hypothetical protein